MPILGITASSKASAAAPDTPTIGSANWGNTNATVSFTAALTGSPATSFTATSTPGGFTATGATSPLTVTGLTNGTAYTFKVKANNAVGSSAESAASNSITPATLGTTTIAYPINGSPWVQANAWNATSGFGTKYSWTAGIGAIGLQSLEFNNAGTAIAGSISVSPFVSAYPWSTGPGTKYANPATLPPSGSDVAWSATGADLALAVTSSPRVIVYPFSAGFGTKYADPATLPTGVGFGVSFRKTTSNAIAVAHSTTPFITAYPWTTGTGFGTKYSNPATLPSSTGRSVSFNSAGTVIAVSHSTSPYISVYPWSSGFGTKYANPATLPSGTGNDVIFNPAGNVIAVAHSISPYITAYPWTTGTGFGTKYSNPSIALPGTGNTVKFSNAGTEIVVANSGTTQISAYKWISGFGTKYANPTTTFTPAVLDITFKS